MIVEVIIGAVLLVGAYFAGAKQEIKPEDKDLNPKSCMVMCESGVSKYDQIRESCSCK